MDEISTLNPCTTKLKLHFPSTVQQGMKLRSLMNLSCATFFAHAKSEYKLKVYDFLHFFGLPICETTNYKNSAIE